MDKGREMTRVAVFFLLVIFASECFAQNKVRPVEELIAPGDTGWIPVQEWIKAATNKVEVLQRDSTRAIDALYHVQVTTRSPMGGVIYSTGGILVDHGWIRILGSGNVRMNRSMPDWNQGKTFNEYGEHTPYYLIADDVLGGFYAVNGGSLGPDVGKIYYLAPDNLKWEAMNYAYSEFLQFCFFSDLDKYYKGYRWKGWEKDLDTLSADMGYTFFPFLWSKEGADIEKDNKAPAPVEELYKYIILARKQLGLDTGDKDAKK